MSNDKVLMRLVHDFFNIPLDWRTIPKYGITNFGHVLSIVLHRQNNLQVELVTFLDAYWDVPTHRHPNVDSIELPIAGDGYAFVEDKPVFTLEEKAAWLNDKLPAKFTYISHEMWHNGRTITASSLLSFQLWLNGVTPKNSIGLDWQGEYSGNLHQQLVQQSEV